MSISAQSRSRAGQFKDLHYRRPRDIDPEDNTARDGDDDDRDGESASDDDEDVTATGTVPGREHYEAVGKSKIRQGRQVDGLGPRYAGSRISRKRALAGEDNEHDPFAGVDSDYESDEAVGRLLMSNEASESGDDGEEDEGEDNEDEDEETDGSDEDRGSEEDAEQEQDTRDSGFDRGQLRELMASQDANVASAIARATQIDAEKGRAVKKQRAAFDSLLNVRIKLQNGLIAANSMPLAETGAENEAINGNGASRANDPVAAAEKAAVRLLDNLEKLRQVVSQSKKQTDKPSFNITAQTGSAAIWKHLQESEGAALSVRRKTLLKWSSKTAGVAGAANHQKLNNTAVQSTIVDVLNENLLSMDRLVKRTRLPRSCAPVQAAKSITESADIYDDADFYGVLLKELLEQRSIDASNVQVQASTVAQHWQAVRQAKTRRVVDTKASKGRKMRFTIHEKLQNFMAPEDRGSWGARQVDELFASLLGRRILLSEQAEHSNDADDVLEAPKDAEVGENGRADEALILF